MIRRDFLAVPSALALGASPPLVFGSAKRSEALGIARQLIEKAKSYAGPVTSPNEVVGVGEAYNLTVEHRRLIGYQVGVSGLYSPLRGGGTSRVVVPEGAGKLGVLEDAAGRIADHFGCQRSFLPSDPIEPLGEEVFSTILPVFSSPPPKRFEARRCPGSHIRLDSPGDYWFVIFPTTAYVGTREQAVKIVWSRFPNASVRFS